MRALIGMNGTTFMVRPMKRTENHKPCATLYIIVVKGVSAHGHPRTHKTEAKEAMSVLSADLELSHPLDRQRLREVGEALFDYSASLTSRPMSLNDLCKLRYRIEGDVLLLLACVGNGSAGKRQRAHEVTLRLLRRAFADYRDGAAALAEMAKTEILTGAEGA